MPLCSSMCFQVCPNAVDVLHDLLGVNLVEMSMQDFSDFLDFEIAYRQHFGQDELLRLEVRLVALGSGAVEHFLAAFEQPGREHRSLATVIRLTKQTLTQAHRGVSPQPDVPASNRPIVKTVESWSRNRSLA